MRDMRHSALQDQEDLSIRGLDAPILVRRHPAARRLTLRVSQTRRTVILTLPPHSDLGEACTFVSRHIDWVRERLTDLPPAVPFQHGIEVPFRGQPHEIIYVGTGRHSDVVRREAPKRLPDGEQVPGRLLVSGQFEHAPRRLTDWFMTCAKKEITERVNWHARNLQLKPKRIAIRDQTTRWGSCSSTGLLSFSWRLILAPSFVLDYLAAHEVAHLQEMNHGPHFWDLVRMTMPRMDEGRHWLRRNGAELHRYGGPMH